MVEERYATILSTVGHITLYTRSFLHSPPPHTYMHAGILWEDGQAS
jgi:hypothetical protein